jgi:hypothetical protein
MGSLAKDYAVILRSFPIWFYALDEIKPSFGFVCVGANLPASE